MKDIIKNNTRKQSLTNIDAIENVIAELPILAKQGIIGTVNIQRALRCGFTKAAKIYDMIKDKSRIKVKKNIFELDKKSQMLYLEQLINDFLSDNKYTTDEAYARLYTEMTLIEELGMAEHFLFAQSVAEILRELNDKPCFVGIGCCSLVAYIIGITNSKLDPIEHGLIFECGFGKGKKLENHFSFFVPEELMPKFMDSINKIYNESLLTKHNGESVLSVGNTQVTIFNSFEPFIHSYAQIETSLSNSGIAFFQEDYMRIIHYTAGYDYTEADKISRIIAKQNETEIIKYRREFVRKAIHLSYVESQRLFTKIQFNFRYASCKAYVLSVKTVLDAYFPF